MRIVHSHTYARTRTRAHTHTHTHTHTHIYIGTEKKVADYWASAMDEAAIEAAGIEPLKPLLDAVAAQEVSK
jgi:predicted metalloendopeptidase